MTDTHSKHPERIGPYAILEMIGEGGMGVVYRAEQKAPLRRHVAVKVMKAVRDSDLVLARFESERRVLAVMDHPFIATVFDAGSTESGLPYFVMELVTGQPITDYADSHRLTLEQRIRLFMDVCGAVQHAHQKGVIHRDLKPSNVLVTEVAGEPGPRVIDFGIAKAVDKRLSERTFATIDGAMVGTPAYMSPEQMEGGDTDIDTRADIYSLGVLLYELLVGRLPVDPGEIGLMPFLARLMAGGKDPPTPGARFRQDDTPREVLAHQRSTDPASLVRSLEGDLGWIISKAIDRDRNRRYQTPNELVADLERHLSHEVVVARPPTMGYRLGKFVRRNRGPVVGGVVAVGALVVGLVVSAAGWIEASRERDRANRELMKAAGVNRFMEESIWAADPRDGIGPDATLLQAIDFAAADMDEVLRDPTMIPEVEASIREAVGWAYFRLQRFEDAIPYLSEALELRKAHLGSRTVETARNMMRLGTACAEVGRLEEADSLFRLSRAEYAAALGEDHADVAFPVKNLALLLLRQGDLDGARVLFSEALDRFMGADSLSRETAEVLGHLGVISYQEGEYDTARDLFRRQLEIQRETLEEDHPLVTESRGNLAASLEQLGDTDGAETEYRAIIAAFEAGGAGTSLDVTTPMSNLALLLDNRGADAEADSLYARLLQIRRSKLPDPHWETATALLNYGVFHCLRDRFDEGLPMLRESVQAFDGYFGEDHWQSGNGRYWLGRCLILAGEPQNAAAPLAKAVEVLTETLGPDHARTTRARELLKQLEERG